MAVAYLSLLPSILRVQHLFQERMPLLPLHLFCKTHCANVLSEIHLINNPIDISQGIYRQRSSPQPKLIWVRAFHEIYNPEMALRVLAIYNPNSRRVT